MVWGSFLIAAAALKTPTRNGYNAQGVNFTFLVFGGGGGGWGIAVAANRNLNFLRRGTQEFFSG